MATQSTRCSGPRPGSILSHGDEAKIGDLAPPSGYAVKSFPDPSRGGGIAVIFRSSLLSHLIVKSRFTFSLNAFNPFTAMMSFENLKPIKVRNLKLLSLFVVLFALACERTFIPTHITERCYRTRKYTVCRHVPASFIPEMLQAGAVKGLNLFRFPSHCSRVLHFCRVCLLTPSET